MRGIAMLLLSLLLTAPVHAQALTAREVGNRLAISTGPDLKQLLEQLGVPSEIVDYYSLSDIVGFIGSTSARVRMLRMDTALSLRLGSACAKFQQR